MSINSIRGNFKKFQEVLEGSGPRLEAHVSFSERINDPNSGIIFSLKWFIVDLSTNQVVIEHPFIDQLRRFDKFENFTIKEEIESSRLSRLKRGKVYSIQVSIMLSQVFNTESVSEFYEEPRMSVSEPTYFSVVV